MYSVKPNAVNTAAPFVVPARIVSFALASVFVLTIFNLLSLVADAVMCGIALVVISPTTLDNPVPVNVTS